MMSRLVGHGPALGDGRQPRAQVHAMLAGHAGQNGRAPHSWPPIHQDDEAESLGQLDRVLRLVRVQSGPFHCSYGDSFKVFFGQHQTPPFRESSMLPIRPGAGEWVTGAPGQGMSVRQKLTPGAAGKNRPEPWGGSATFNLTRSAQNVS